jgi:hypothetical protein
VSGFQSGADELLEVVANAGGAIEPHLLSARALASLPFVGRLRQIACEVCSVVLIADHRRRFCVDCGTARENRAQWAREKARKRRRR